MSDKHLSSQFDDDFRVLLARLNELGLLVDGQICRAIDALLGLDSKGAQRVLATEAEVNALEVEIDYEITSIIAKRQPVALDLRLLMAISKSSTNLERIGNETDKIARKVLLLIQSRSPRGLPTHELRLAANLSTELLRRAMKAFSLLNVTEAMAVMKEQELGHMEFDEFVGKLIKSMMENLNATSYCVELISLAKSLELITDHAKHIAELVIYVVAGTNVHQTPIDQI
ncbi:MAG: phosphate signaling complex protein PhoU [Betaproteobacteria bacterium]